MWTATDHGSRRLSAYQRSSSDDYVAWIEALLAAGEGYTQVHHVGRLHPLLALSFKDGYAVIHLFDDDGRVFLMAGDGVVETGESVPVPVLDDVDYAEFTGEYVLSAGRAWAVVQDFLRLGDVEDLRVWQQL